MAHRKNALGTSYRRSTDNLTAADSSVSPTCKSSQTSLGACLHINVHFFFLFLCMRVLRAKRNSDLGETLQRPQRQHIRHVDLHFGRFDPKRVADG